MMRKKMPAEISRKDAELCGMLGCVGAAIATVVLLQHLYFMVAIWIAYIMALVYMLSIIAFVLLATKKNIAPVLLIISSGLTLATVLYHTLAVAFSMLVTLLMLYSIIVTIVIYIEEMPRKLNAHYLYKKSENDYWENKL